MPNEVGDRFLFKGGKGNHAKGIDDSPAEDPEEQREILLYPIWDKHDGTPADHKIEDEMEPSHPAGPEDSDEGNARRDDGPLGGKETNSPTKPPHFIDHVNQIKRRKSASDF